MFHNIGHALETVFGWVAAPLVGGPRGDGEEGGALKEEDLLGFNSETKVCEVALNDGKVGHEVSGDEACTNPYTSPTVWVVLKRAGSLVPSGSWIRMVIVGCEESRFGKAADEAPVEEAARGEGAAGWALVVDDPAPGTGLPRRWPEPSKGLYFFGCGV